LLWCSSWCPDRDLKMAADPLAKIAAARESDPDGYTIADLWNETLAKGGDRPCLIYAGDETSPPRTMSFKQVEAASNQVGHWALSKGLRPGQDCAALFMENRPEFIVTWLGFAKVGVKTAWINNTIKLQPLVHSISVASACMVVFGVELADVVKEVLGELATAGIEAVCSGGDVPFCSSMDSEVAAQVLGPLPRSVRKGIRYSDTMCYIYTSGTTGLPKAALIYHETYLKAGMNVALGLGLTADDIVYGSGMPLYHSAAGMLGVSTAMFSGAAYVIRRKFSAKAWLDDVKTYNATMAQYIGELARYILSLPEKPDDADNKLTRCIGNGLRPEYWDKFQLRFGIDVILEFYGATEGTSGFSNAIFLENLRKGDRTGYGSIGQLADPNVVFARFNIETDELIRGPDGFCLRAAVNEPGEMLVKVTPSSTFRGYTDKASTQKKLLADVFEKGDMYTRTGDLLKVDSDGWVYFVDRIGDTFRWKGENVSTAEVATELAKFPGVDEVNVYGVQIPNNEDGRAGMSAMIMPDVSDANLAAFYRHASANLPSYAVPLFLRILPAMQITGTFKHQKVQMRNDGIDLSKVSDPIYFLDKGAYKLMDAAAYARLTGGPQARL